MTLIRRYFRSSIVLAVTFLAMLSLSSCRNWRGYWVEATIQNQTGHAIHELEVDYPSASFGANGLAPGASMHYRFQINGSGPVKVNYTAEDGKLTHAQGLTLAENQHGQLTIRLLPAGKVEFVPTLLPAS